MVQTRTIGVMLVDDHAIVRTGFRRLLEDSPDIRVVGEAADGEEALKVYAEVRPDVVVLDVSMPEGMGGLEATARLLAVDSAARILILSAYEEEPYPSRLIQAGARGYLSKRCAPAELGDAVRAVVRGEKYLSSGGRPEVGDQPDDGQRGHLRRAVRAGVRGLSPPGGVQVGRADCRHPLPLAQDRWDASHKHHEEARNLVGGRARAPRHPPRNRGGVKRTADRPGRYAHVSTLSPSTRENSRMLCVTSVTSRLKAWAAIMRSMAPIETPRFSKSTRIGP